MSSAILQRVEAIVSRESAPEPAEGKFAKILGASGGGLKRYWSKPLSTPGRVLAHAGVDRRFELSVCSRERGTRWRVNDWLYCYACFLDSWLSFKFWPALGLRGTWFWLRAIPYHRRSGRTLCRKPRAGLASSWIQIVGPARSSLPRKVQIQRSTGSSWAANVRPILYSGIIPWILAESYCGLRRSDELTA